VTARERRRRAAALAALAIAAGGLAASEVRTRVDEVEARTGPLVPAVVARKELPAGARLGGDPSRALAVRAVPARYVPPDVLASPAEAAGLRVRAGVARGGYVTASVLTVPDARSGEPGRGASLRAGERAVELAVAGGPGLAPGARVDVLVTSERGGEAGRTYVALEDAELLDLRAGAPQEAEGARGAAGARATLRVTAGQAVFLTAAQSFARELRLLARPPGDERRLGPLAVEKGEL
jgi:pilus assembly protein CpaB